MRWLFLCFWTGLGCLPLAHTQQLELQFHLIDEATGQSISDAHVFISDSSLGTTSASDGNCALKVPIQETQVLIITHLSYETLVVPPERFPDLIDGAVLELQSNGVDLSEIQLTAKRSNQWKKKFRRVRKVLLGEDKAAGSCKILNPEVLRFEEKDGTLWASAVDLIQIENDYLGYTIRFWLQELSIEADGSTYFKGNGQFIDKAAADDERRLKRRERAYRNSLPHFLRSLLESPDKVTLENHGYQLLIEKYHEGEFISMLAPEPSALIHPDTTVGRHRLIFPEFLTIKHENLKIASAKGLNVAVSSAEQQKFGSTRTQSIGSSTENAISRLYKIAPYLLFDQRGNIINKAAVREYGYWAEQRLATTLPIDYAAFSNLKAKEPVAASTDTLLIFQKLIGYEQQGKTDALQFLQDNWSLSYVAPLLDILLLSQDPWQIEAISALLDEHVPSIEHDYFKGIQWLWENTPDYGHYYADFKAYLYSALDPAFHQYFHKRTQQAKIRLDEIVWGGVRQDGIPPLRAPKMMPAEQADYLADNDVVFGLVINGKARAYPKRILAWHEFFTDEIGEQSIAGVYCTLCGTVIIYDTKFNGVKYRLGTSGFLYRSNKLMYDQSTQSLWSTILGQPVVGPLVDQGIELTTLPVETTSWSAWRKRHPDTQVLSLETGHERDYAEGEAYKDYFADDQLMFPVPLHDQRLPNKARVFIPRPDNYATQPLAISVKYLQRKRIHQDTIGSQQLLIIAESNGASRAYAIDDQQFQSYKRGRLLDQNGEEWRVAEKALTGPDGQQLLRLSAHEAFWFAWVNVFPETRLVD